MSVLLRGIPFSTEEQLDCFSLSLDSLLRFYGLELALLHFDEWHFSLLGTNPGSLLIAAHTRDCAASLARFGVELRRRQEADFSTGWTRLCAELDQGRPALVLLDTCPLRACYYPGRPLHTPHTVVVNGYGGDKVSIVDPSPHKAFAGSIPLEVFAPAWQAAALGGQGFVWCALQVPGPLAPRSPQDILACLRQSTEGMLGGERAGWGIAGLRQLAGWIEEAVAWQEALQAALLAQLTQLKWVGLARRQHARFLAHAGARLEEPELAALGTQVEEVAQEWMVARNLALKGHRRPTAGMALRLSCRLEALAEWEELLLRRLDERMEGR
ncbi:MAG: hypothetical protein HYW07_13280 [Candidatus Latescibacteria bacterium]|nr:hypothetical protein [Candidatus Latescibacterota bacterium]